MKRFSNFSALAAGALMGSMLVFPREAAESVLAGLAGFACGVLPALLPFSVCALLLTAGRSLPVPLLTLLSLLGGSPAGARLFQDARLPTGAARRCAAMTGVMSPMFFLSALSAWLGSPRAGAVLLGVHITSALGCGLLLRERPQGRIALPPLSVPQAIFQGSQAMLAVAGSVALGAAAARMTACALPGLPPRAAAVLHSLLEISGGCRALAEAGAPLPLLSALLSFSGLSILLQNAAFWQKNGLGPGTLAALGLLRAALAFLLCAVLVQLRVL